MELSHEDSLRLNVLLAQQLKAVRIDESAMVVHALTERGEAKVPLRPTGRDDHYLRAVRELLSTHVLDSPGGYPVYLRRWTRMGQARTGSLDRLLLLGEPEAVVAVVHAEGLSDELARRAWWAMPIADNARCMLERDSVASGSMGPELAAFLVEFLPFEEEPRAIMDSVRLVLKPGLIDESTRLQLWNRAKRKNTYFVGFLQALPDALPESAAPHPQHPYAQARLDALCEAANPIALQLVRCLSGAGQAYLKTAEEVLLKPNNQDVVVALLETLAEYFAAACPAVGAAPDIEGILVQASASDPDDAGQEGALQAVRDAAPELDAVITAMRVLAQLGETLVAPVFARTDAIGTVMRRKIEPITTPIVERLRLLRGVVDASGRPV
jgi:hypothetical protein